MTQRVCLCAQVRSRTKRDGVLIHMLSEGVADAPSGETSAQLLPLRLTLFFFYKFIINRHAFFVKRHKHCRHWSRELLVTDVCCLRFLAFESGLVVRPSVLGGRGSFRHALN